MKIEVHQLRDERFSLVLDDLVEPRFILDENAALLRTKLSRQEVEELVSKLQAVLAAPLASNPPIESNGQ